MEQDTTCPYCNERPLVKRKNARTCGDKACQRARTREDNKIAYDADPAAYQDRKRKGSGGLIPRACMLCSETFCGTRKRRYCSIACANMSRSKRAILRPTVDVEVQCRVCGQAFIPSGESVGFACSRSCDSSRRSAPRSDLHFAWERGSDDFFEALRFYSRQTERGCWEWPRANKNGYVYVNLGKRSRPLHRAALEAKVGGDLGPDQAHHVCGNRRCVNPDHLQRVSQRENVAEMLQRNYFIKRIAELEDALRAVDPTHPALTLPHAA